MILATTGCGSIVNGGMQKLDVRSPTPNADIHIKSFKGDEIYSGPSPAKVEVSRKDQYTIEVSAPGYRPMRQVVWQNMSGWTIGNLIWILPIFWGVGIAVDAMTGGVWTLSPDSPDLNLRLLPPPPPSVVPVKVIQDAPTATP